MEHPEHLGEVLGMELRFLVELERLDITEEITELPLGVVILVAVEVGLVDLDPMDQPPGGPAELESRIQLQGHLLTLEEGVVVVISPGLAALAALAGEGEVVIM